MGGGPSIWNVRTSNTACGLAAVSSFEIPEAFNTWRIGAGRPYYMHETLLLVRETHNSQLIQHVIMFESE